MTAIRAEWRIVFENFVTDLVNARLRNEEHIKHAYEDLVECEENNPCPAPCDQMIIEWHNTQTTITSYETQIRELTITLRTLTQTRDELEQVCPEFLSM